MTGSITHATNLRFRFTGGPEDLRDKTVPILQAAGHHRGAHHVGQHGGDVHPRAGRGPGHPAPEEAPFWKGPAGAAVDAARLNALIAALSDLTCEKFIPDRGKESFGRPVFPITLVGGKEHSLSIFAPSGTDSGERPAVSSASDSPFILAQDQVKTIMQVSGGAAGNRRKKRREEIIIFAQQTVIFGCDANPFKKKPHR